MKSELGQDPRNIFENFDNDTLPIAAASLGLVYKLSLKKNKEMVAVKVQRPDILAYIVRYA